MANTPNPYAKGLNIAGTGANGASTNFSTVWDPQTSTWGVQTGSGIVPIFTASQMGGISSSLPSNYSFSPNSIDTSGYDGPSQYAPAQTPGLTIQNSNGGSTTAGYTLDPSTGYYIPTSMQGRGAPSSSLLGGILPPLEVIGGAAGLSAGIGALAGGAASGGAVDAATTGGSVGGASGAVGDVGMAAAAPTGASTAFGMSPGAASFDPGYSAMIDGSANAGTDAATMGYGAVGSPGSAAFAGTGIPSGITGGSSLLSSALSNPALVGKALTSIAGIAGLGGSGTSGGASGGGGMGALQGSVGGGVGQGQTVGGQNQKLAQMLLASPYGEGVV